MLHRHAAPTLQMVQHSMHATICSVLQILSLSSFRPATLAEVCAVHDQRYPAALQRIARQQQPAQHTLVEGAPTYVTSSSFDDAVQVCSATPFFQLQPVLSCHDRSLLDPDIIVRIASYLCATLLFFMTQEYGPLDTAVSFVDE